MLGVQPTATADEIKTAYRRMLRQVHPDAGGNAALFRMVGEAWAVLRDTGSRAAYDRHLREGEPKPKAHSDPSPQETFAQAYAQAAAQERARQEAAQRQWVAREQHEAMRQAQAITDEARTRPYVIAVRSLRQRDQRAHLDKGVPLTFVLRWRRMRRWLWRIVLAACLSFGVLGAVSSDLNVADANPFYMLLYLPTALFGALLLYVPLRVFGGIALAIVRAVVMPRRAMTGWELQEEYLATASRFKAKPSPSR
ncbi:hypothetical protein ASF76_00305 [Microbacterium sp. Leaf151]|nr:hypothetical protein ASF76_00305 [Microbacterium sp. Leaf151]